MKTEIKGRFELMKGGFSVKTEHATWYLQRVRRQWCAYRFRPGTATVVAGGIGRTWMDAVYNSKTLLKGV